MPRGLSITLYDPLAAFETVLRLSCQNYSAARMVSVIERSDSQVLHASLRFRFVLALGYQSAGLASAVAPARAKLNLTSIVRRSSAFAGVNVHFFAAPMARRSK